MKSLPIRIITRQFELVGEVDRYSSLQILRSWHGMGAIELRINRYLEGANELTKGRIIFPLNKLNKAYVIRYREIELDSNGKATENWRIQALPLKSWTGQRITYPPDHTGYDNKQADAETVMRHYVSNNLVSPVDVRRAMEDIILAENLQRGISLNWQSRYGNLAEELAEMSIFSGLGWNVSIDTDSKKFIFEVLEGRDLTNSQRILPPAVFSPEYDTLGQMTFIESELNYRNSAIVAGQGEGEERRIIEIGEFTGFDRYELFVDARDVAEEMREDEDSELLPRPEEDINNDLAIRGEQKLNEYQQELYLEGQALTKSELRYERDYDLGDMVTLQNKEWGVTLDTRITEVKEIYEPGNVKVELTFGNNRPTLISKIKQELSQISGEVRK